MILEDGSFGSFLEKQGNVSGDLLRIIRREMQKQKKSLEKTLLSLSVFNETQLAELLSQFSKLPFTNPLEIKSFSSEIQKYLPKDLPPTPLWVPFKKENSNLHIAISNPLDTLGVAHIQNQLSPFKCIFYIALPSQIRPLLQKHKKKMRRLYQKFSSDLMNLHPHFLLFLLQILSLKFSINVY
jgi:hypothetical protein